MKKILLAVLVVCVFVGLSFAKDPWGTKLYRDVRELTPKATSYVVNPSTGVVTKVNARDYRNELWVINKSTRSVWMAFTAGLSGTEVYENGIELEANDTSALTEENKFKSTIYTGAIYLIYDPVNEAGKAVTGDVRIVEFYRP